MSVDQSSRILQKVYSARTTGELETAYDEWAEDYDAHVTGFGWKSPAVAAGLLGRYVRDLDTPVLDAEAGSGLVGELLMIMGYRHQVGIDLSGGMLARAERTGAYRELRRMALGEPLGFPDGRFGACQSVGVFTAGHAPASAFDELTRVVAPGGYIVFSLLESVHEAGGFRDKFDALAAAGRWELAEKTTDYAALPFEDPAIRHRVYAFRVRG